MSLAGIRSIFLTVAFAALAFAVAGQASDAKDGDVVSGNGVSKVVVVPGTGHGLEVTTASEAVTVTPANDSRNQTTDATSTGIVITAANQVSDETASKPVSPAYDEEPADTTNLEKRPKKASKSEGKAVKKKTPMATETASRRRVRNGRSSRRRKAKIGRRKAGPLRTRTMQSRTKRNGRRHVEKRRRLLPNHGRRK